MKRNLIWFGCFLLLVSVFTAFRSSEPNPLQGAWQVESIAWITPDTTYRIKEAQPGILMISSTRYSFIWTPTDEPRKPFKVLAEPTAEEFKAGFTSIVFNAGRCQIKANQMINTAEIARVPGFEGGEQVFNWELNNNVLTLTMYDETYPNGEKPKWLGKLKTEFVLTRLD